MNKNDLRVTVYERATLRREVVARGEGLEALAPLGIEHRRRILRWTCDRYMIDPTKLPLP